MATTPEGRVKAKIKEYLKSIGAWYFMPIGGSYSVVGIPDIVGCYHGRFFAIEVKAPGKKRNTTPLQDAAIRAIGEHGGGVIVADCVEDVKDLFAPLLLAYA